MSNLLPYNHQLKAIDNVLNGELGLTNQDRIQLIMSCGTGKSLVSMWVHEKFVSNLSESITLLFYPSLFLINQTYNAYKENTILKFNPLVVCSDTAIGENENDDIFELDASEVKYPVTTNVEDIKTYLQDKLIKDKIVFITYQSCELIGIALNELHIKVDLGIFDEAHKTATVNIESKFAYGLKDENIPISKRLFMTATPRHIKFNSDEDEEEIEVFSMNNPELYGDIAYEYPMRKAINDGIITDYKIMGILIDDKYIDSYTNELKPFSEDVINEAKIKAINEAMNKYGLNKALIFNRDIVASKELEKYSNTSIFNKTIKHLDGSSKHSYREQVLQELNDNEQFVITNAKLFTEGVDLPTIDMVALFRNVKSEIDIIQTVGRVQRKDKNNPNKIGYILLPIFVSNIDLIDDELKTNKDLGYIYEVINSLKENDELLKNTFEYKKIYKKNPNFEIDYILNNTNISDEDDYIYKINEKITYKIATVILNKRNSPKMDKEWKKLFIEFNKQYGLDALEYNTRYKNEELGYKLRKIKKEYINSSPFQRQNIKEYWNCIPERIWEEKIKSDTEWKELFIGFNKEKGIEKLKQDTVYKNENIGTKFTRLKKDYIKSTPEQQKKLKDFWDCFPDDFWNLKRTDDTEWKQLFIDFLNNSSFNELKKRTIYKNKNLGLKLSTIKINYMNSTSSSQKEMREFWDCFPDDFWFIKKIDVKTDSEWKQLSIDFLNNNSFKNLKQRTIFKNENIGTKFTRLKKDYIKSTPEQQKKLKDFWDCFPDDFWKQKEQ